MSEPAALNIAFGLEALLFRALQNLLYLQITAKFRLLTFFHFFCVWRTSYSVLAASTL